MLVSCTAASAENVHMRVAFGEVARSATEVLEVAFFEMAELAQVHLVPDQHQLRRPSAYQRANPSSTSTSPRFSPPRVTMRSFRP